MYDIARGGCGYSQKLDDPDELNRVLKYAISEISDYICKCEEREGACGNCLMDRSTMRSDKYLSKKKALDWLKQYSEISASVPSDISSIYPHLERSIRNIETILNAASRDKNTTGITLVLSDWPDKESFESALSSSSLFGNIILKAKSNNIPLNILVEYLPDLHPEPLDKVPFTNLNLLFQYISVKLVSDLGNIKPVASIQSGGFVKRYFSDNSDLLEISEKIWVRLRLIFILMMKILITLKRSLQCYTFQMVI